MTAISEPKRLHLRVPAQYASLCRKGVLPRRPQCLRAAIFDSQGGQAAIKVPLVNLKGPALQHECFSGALHIARRSSSRVGAQRKQNLQLEQQKDNGIPFGVLAIAYAGLGAFISASPHTAANLVFGDASGPHDYLHEVFFRLLAIIFELVAVVNIVQQDAADEGRLAETIHRRANASLSFFAATCLGLPLCSYVAMPIVTPQAGVVFGLLSAAQWLVAGRGYAKHSPEGADPFAILGSYFKDLKRLPKIDGLNSGLYSLFTATFIFIGFAFLFTPGPTKAGMFGIDPALGAEDQLLFQLLGGSIATVVGPVCYTQQEAALENNFSQRPKRALMAGLAVACAVYVFTLLPLLNTDKSGSLLFWAGLPWGTAAVASALIAVKPKENEGWYTPW